MVVPALGESSIPSPLNAILQIKLPFQAIWSSLCLTDHSITALKCSGMTAPIFSQMSISLHRAGGLAGSDNPFLKINSSITPVYLTKSIKASSSSVSEALAIAWSKRSAVRTGLALITCRYRGMGWHLIIGRHDSVDQFNLQRDCVSFMAWPGMACQSACNGSALWVWGSHSKKPWFICLVSSMSTGRCENLVNMEKRTPSARFLLKMRVVWARASLIKQIRIL